MFVEELATGNGYELAARGRTVTRLMTLAKSAARTHAARLANLHHRKYVSYRQGGFQRIIAKHAGRTRRSPTGLRSDVIGPEPTWT
jgi:hypothetical protein